MSKQTEAKQAQGYRTDPQNCGNCKHRACERRLPSWMVKANAQYVEYPRYTLAIHGEEASQRCSIGGFAIRKTATCAKWELSA